MHLLSIKLLNSLALLQKEGTLCDVFLQVQEDSAAAPSEACGVWAHRAVLAAASPYFLCLFTKFRERTETVTIKGVELAVLRAIVNYIYRPESLPVTADNAQALVAAASLLAVDGVRDEACAFLERALTVDNVVGIRGFAEQHACDALTAAGTRFVDRHYVDVLKADEALELPADALATLLDSLTVSAEEHVLDAVLQWTEHCPPERRRHLAELLQRVRLPAVPHEVLAERAQDEPLASADLSARNVIIKALTFHCQRADRRAQYAAASAWYHPRKPRDFSLLVVGGLANTGISSDVLRHELSTGLWQSGPALPAPRYSAGVAELYGRVYVVGGHDGCSPQSTVVVLDVGTGSWTAGPALRTTRADFGVAVLGGVLYAVGGQDDGGASLRSAEALDPREGVWRSIADMSSGRAGVGVASLGGLLYAAGGWDGKQDLHTVERYDPTGDSWRPAESMAGGRGYAGAGVVDHELYVVGGYDGSTELRSMERYRAGAGWQPAPDMSARRWSPAVQTHAGRLYVAGGRDSSDNLLSSVAVFEPATGAWSELPAAMPAGRWCSGAVVIDWSSATP